MINRLIDWFLSPTVKNIDDDFDMYSKLIELEEMYDTLLLDIKRLEEENVELTNELYRLENSLDARIDILYNEFRKGT